MKISLFETQLELLDRVVGEGALGDSREQVLFNALDAHISHLLAGGSPYDHGGAHFLELPRPAAGDERYSETLQPVTGVAVPVYTGEVLRIAQVEGGQCVDFNAFNLQDYKEHLDCGFTRTRQPVHVRPGDLISTGAPRGRPMFTILTIPETCDVFLRGHRCNGIFFEREWAVTQHPSCQDTIAEAIRAYGLTPDDVHDSYNLWMSTEFDDRGRLCLPWNRAKSGDYVEFLAQFDVLAVPVVCGSSDLTGISNYRFAPIQVQVFEASAASKEVVRMVNETWGKFANQKTPVEFKARDIRATRELEPDPNYVAEFRSVPREIELEVEIPAEKHPLLRGLVARGLYGEAEGEALKVAFMRWFQANRKTDTYIAVNFT